MAATYSYSDEQVSRPKSSVSARSSEFKQRVKEMETLIERLREELALATSEGKDRHIERHRKRGKLLARERISLLLDEDSPFLEIAPLAGHGVEGITVGASVVCGIGIICGVICGITANVPTIKGGSSNEYSIKRSFRMGEIIRANRLPVVQLVESAGADLRDQAKVFHVGGGAFRGITNRSKEKLPTISVVFGSCTAGGAYTPGMSDYVIMVKNQAQVFLAGPPLVKMATGEVTTPEELGGAEMHSAVSGVSDYLAENEEHALFLAREAMTTIRNESVTPLPMLTVLGEADEPFYDPQELLGIVPTDLSKPFEITEVILRIVDGSRFIPFKENYGTTIVTGFAQIHGMDVGLIGNNGPLFPDSAQKATQFIHLCNARDIPLVFLQNITGFMVGRKYEQDGIIRHGANMINAVSNSEVPAITIIVGASYGAGNYAMCGRAYAPRFLFSWPNSKVAVMGSEQLVGVMEIVQRGAAKARGIELDDDLVATMRAKAKARVEATSDAYFVTSNVIDDGIIDPRDTRTIISFCLQVAHNTPIVGTPGYGVPRM